MGTFKATFQTDSTLDATFQSPDAFSSSFDNAIISPTPCINDVKLIGNKTSAEIAVMDAATNEGVHNAILKLGDDNKPQWSSNIFAAEQAGSEERQGQAILSLGSTSNEYSLTGASGMLRIFRGNAIGYGKLRIYGQRPESGNYLKDYIFGFRIPNQIGYVLSSSHDSNTSGALAKFEDGLSIVSGIMENAVELNTNKVTAVTAVSTDEQYPSAKCVYNAIEDVTTDAISETEIDAICV